MKLRIFFPILIVAILALSAVNFHLHHKNTEREAKYLFTIDSLKTLVLGRKNAKLPVTDDRLDFQENPYKNKNLEIKIINADTASFGYDIFMDGLLMIHQPNIPGLPGNKGFTSREKAMAVAHKVVKKIKKNKMPPTLTIEELKELNAI
ncbi:MAG TPA: DUF4907 domain-containing protein [Bacteroidales bacterium]|nr:DUF4907 domain-containing protein [Bacteroidales bacterium]